MLYFSPYMVFLPRVINRQTRPMGRALTGLLFLKAITSKLWCLFKSLQDYFCNDGLRQRLFMTDQVDVGLIEYFLYDLQYVIKQNNTIPILRFDFNYDFMKNLFVQPKYFRLLHVSNNVQLYTKVPTYLLEFNIV